VKLEPFISAWGDAALEWALISQQLSADWAQIAGTLVTTTDQRVSVERHHARNDQVSRLNWLNSSPAWCHAGQVKPCTSEDSRVTGITTERSPSAMSCPARLLLGKSANQLRPGVAQSFFERYIANAEVGCSQPITGHPTSEKPPVKV